MKKVLICMLTAAAMLPCATAFAGRYDAGQNAVIVNAGDKQTVIIARNTGLTMTDDDIVYVGQEESGFPASNAIFKLKDSPATGFYTIMFGGKDVAATKKTFFIGDASAFTKEAELTPIENYEIKSEDGKTVTKAYTTSVDTCITPARAKAVVVKYGDKYAYEELGTVLSGETSVQLAVKLVGIPEKDKDNVQVWISSTEISTKDLIMK